MPGSNQMAAMGGTDLTHDLSMIRGARPDAILYVALCVLHAESTRACVQVCVTVHVGMCVCIVHGHLHVYGYVCAPVFIPVYHKWFMRCLVHSATALPPFVVGTGARPRHCPTVQRLMLTSQ